MYLYHVNLTNQMQLWNQNEKEYKTDESKNEIVNVNLIL